MTARTKNLAVAGGAVALLGIVGVNVLVSPPPAGPPLAPSVEPEPARSAPGLPGTAVAEAGSAPSPAATPAVPSTRRSSYAVGLAELQGLPPDAAPGSSFELWVTWERPITDEPRLQRLIGDVVLERLIPGTVPEAPVTALLSVPAARTGDLIYADTFGRLSAVVPG